MNNLICEQDVMQFQVGLNLYYDAFVIANVSSDTKLYINYICFSSGYMGVTNFKTAGK